MTSAEDTKRDLAMLSGASMWEDRIDGPSVPRPLPGRSMSRSREGGDSEPRSGNTVNHLGWDDVDRDNFELASESAQSLLSDLRASKDPLERARIVATHSTGKDGGLDVNEAKLVMHMTRFKKIEAEHLTRLGQVRLSSGDDEGDEEDEEGAPKRKSSGGGVGGRTKKTALSQQSSTVSREADEDGDVSSVEGGDSEDDVEALQESQARRKAEGLEKAQKALQKRIRDLEKALTLSEQKKHEAENQKTSYQHRFAEAEGCHKSVKTNLASTQRELALKAHKVSVLEARASGAPPPPPPPRPLPVEGDSTLEADTQTASKAFPSAHAQDGKGVRGFLGRFRNGGKDKAAAAAAVASAAVATTPPPPALTTASAFAADTSLGQTSEPMMTTPPNKAEKQKKAISREVKRALVVATRPGSVKGGSSSGTFPVKAGKLVVRTLPEYPGISAGAVLNPGAVFEYRTSKTESLAIEGLKMRVQVTFYELSDGRGWVPDFAKTAGPGVRVVEDLGTETIADDNREDGDDVGGGKRPATLGSLGGALDTLEDLQQQLSGKKPTPSMLPSSPSIAGGGSGRTPVKTRAGRGTPAAKKKKKKAEEEELPTGPQLLEIRFEFHDQSSSDLSTALGLVLCPTKFGLEVVHVSKQALAKAVPLGSILTTVAGRPLGLASSSSPASTSQQPPPAPTTANKGLGEGRDKEGGGGGGGGGAVVVTESAFLAAVREVAPRPVKIGFLVEAQHKAVLQLQLVKVQRQLKQSEDMLRKLKEDKALTAAAASATAVAASLSGMGNSGGSGGKAPRLTMKQRQEALRKKQEASKQQRKSTGGKTAGGAGAGSKVGGGGGGGKGGDAEVDLPDYLKHCTVSQKRAYVSLVASERGLTQEVEECKFKVLDTVEKCELAEDGAEEANALLGECQRDLSSSKVSAAELSRQVASLKEAVGMNEVSAGIMKVKDERLKHLEGEVQGLRSELLAVANIRGDNEQLKEWLEAERRAHDKQVRVYSSGIEKLNKDLAMSQASSSKLKSSLNEHEAAIVSNNLGWGEAEDVWRERERDLVEEMVRELLLEQVSNVALACEGATTTTSYTLLGKRPVRRRSDFSGEATLKTVEGVNEDNAALSTGALPRDPAGLFVGPAVVVTGTNTTTRRPPLLPLHERETNAEKKEKKKRGGGGGGGGGWWGVCCLPQGSSLETSPRRRRRRRLEAAVKALEAEEVAGFEKRSEHAVKELALFNELAEKQYPPALEVVGDRQRRRDLPGRVTFSPGHTKPVRKRVGEKGERAEEEEAVGEQEQEHERRVFQAGAEAVVALARLRKDLANYLVPPTENKLVKMGSNNSGVGGSGGLGGNNGSGERRGVPVSGSGELSTEERLASAMMAMVDSDDDANEEGEEEEGGGGGNAGVEEEEQEDEDLVLDLSDDEEEEEEGEDVMLEAALKLEKGTSI